MAREFEMKVQKIHKNVAGMVEYDATGPIFFNLRTDHF